FPESSRGPAQIGAGPHQETYPMRCLALVLLTAAPVFAEDWPQWLGPRRDGSSSEKVEAWKEAPKILWHIPVGEGHGSPVVAAGAALRRLRLAAHRGRQGPRQCWREGRVHRRLRQKQRQDPVASAR